MNGSVYGCGEISVARAVYFLAFVGTVWGANWALATYGVVGIGFGVMAPAGVFFAGLAFTFRDLLHESSGRLLVVAAILVGAGLSALLEGAQGFAVASGTAFIASEAADFIIFTPLRRRGWLRAVAVSNGVGFTADSLLFLWLAFGSLDFIEGQLIGKAYMTGLAIVVLWMWRHEAPKVLRRVTPS
jgi:uncharacterized PurR-regulated membrane protein YhhQ (DUF165 family)